jgi:hypothetical protein
MCLVNGCTTNSIFRKTKYLQTLIQRCRTVLIITGHDATIVDSGRATITFSNGTQVMIEDVLLYLDSTRTLINFRDIRKSGLHVCTHEDNKEESLFITKSSEYGYGYEVLERIHSTPTELYYTYIKLVSYVTYKVIFHNVIHSRPSIHA